MPKVIDGLEEKILASARDRMLGEDIAQFSLRGVAKDCGIAVGTIYNYYRDKEYLMGAVMAQDWLHELGRMKEDILAAGSFEEGMIAIYRAVSEFSRIYEKVWQTYSTGAGFGARYRERHSLLLRQIREELKTLYERFSVEISEGEDILLAEVIISAAQHMQIKEADLLRLISITYKTQREV